LSRQGNWFLALRPPEGTVAEPLLQRLAAIDPAVRPVPPEGLHITVQFLGRVPSTAATAVVEVAGRATAAQGRFWLGWGGLGSFPSARRPAVVWVGVAAGEPRLRQLAGALGSRLAAAKLPFDARSFRAHCTLARITGELPPSALREVRRLLAERPVSGRFEARVVELLESEAVPGAPNRYRVVASFQLGAAEARLPLEGSPVPGVEDREHPRG